MAPRSALPPSGEKLLTLFISVSIGPVPRRGKKVTFRADWEQSDQRTFRRGTIYLHLVLWRRLCETILTPIISLSIHILPLIQPGPVPRQSKKVTFWADWEQSGERTFLRGIIGLHLLLWKKLCATNLTSQNSLWNAHPCCFHFFIASDSVRNFSFLLLLGSCWRYGWADCQYYSFEKDCIPICTKPLGMTVE